MQLNQLIVNPEFVGCMNHFFFFLEKIYKIIWKNNTIIFITFALWFQLPFLFSQFFTKPLFCKAAEWMLFEKTNRQQVRKIREQYWVELASGDAMNFCNLAIQLSH